MPLVLVLVVSLLKEAFEDRKRSIKDAEVRPSACHSMCTVISAELGKRAIVCNMKIERDLTNMSRFRQLAKERIRLSILVMRVGGHLDILKGKLVMMQWGW